ncbi:hypothetical protein D0865_14822 [Hortaea werneckii]|uniref:SGNH hydrolase-type esterase domain-containing protein n=1 Tax=Hortaea werneckii TaxID=91943 RepID=A0A3M7AX07_HORWE|nr:hypothetical protein D0865_14822 [Hortaea werneckii]
MANFRYLIIALCLVALAASKSINNGMKLKILPLGASIVWGQNSADGNGFRGGLRKALIAGGNKYVSMVGTPRTFILLSTLIPSRNANQEACIRRFNAALPGVVAAAKRGGQKVALVDMHAVVPVREISGDGTHPTNAGYQLMAKAWYRAMVKHAGKISAPNPKGRPAPR